MPLGSWGSIEELYGFGGVGYAGLPWKTLDGRTGAGDGLDECRWRGSKSSFTKSFTSTSVSLRLFGLDAMKF